MGTGHQVALRIAGADAAALEDLAEFGAADADIGEFMVGERAEFAEHGAPSRQFEDPFYRGSDVG